MRSRALSTATATGALGRAEHLRGRVGVVRATCSCPGHCAAVAELRPDELYHLAAPTFVPDSWRHPARTMNAIVVGTATL